MGCFVHVILLGVGCFVSLQKNMWWFSSTYNKMDVGCFVRGVFCPTLDQSLFVLIGSIMTNFLNQITGFITHLNCLSQTVKYTYFSSLINSYIIELLKTVD